MILLELTGLQEGVSLSEQWCCLDVKPFYTFTVHVGCEKYTEISRVTLQTQILNVFSRPELSHLTWKQLLDLFCKQSNLKPSPHGKHTGCWLQCITNILKYYLQCVLYFHSEVTYYIVIIVVPKSSWGL